MGDEPRSDRGGVRQQRRKRLPGFVYAIAGTEPNPCAWFQDENPSWRERVTLDQAEGGRESPLRSKPSRTAATVSSIVIRELSRTSHPAPPESRLGWRFLMAGPSIAGSNGLPRRLRFSPSAISREGARSTFLSAWPP